MRMMRGGAVVAVGACAISPGIAAQEVPFGSPEVVAPGSISDGNAWRGSLSPDGRVLYYFRRESPGEEDYRIYLSRRSDDGWSAPEQISFSGADSDLYPAISPDGTRMILTSYRAVEGVSVNAHLFESRWLEGAWTPPEYVPGLNEPGSYHAQPYFTADGTLHFRRVGRGGPRLYRAAARDGEFLEPREVPFRELFDVPTGALAGAFFTPSGCGAVLTVQVAPGDVDLYWSRRDGRGWTRAVPMDHAVNTPAMELFPFFSGDGGTLYFVRAFSELLAVPVLDTLWTAACG